MPGIQVSSQSYGAATVPAGYVPASIGASPSFGIGDIGTFVIVFVGGFLFNLYAGATLDVEAWLELADGTNITGTQVISRFVPGTDVGPPFTQYGVVPLSLGASIGFIPAPRTLAPVKIVLTSDNQPFQSNGGSGIWLLARQAD